MAPFAGISIKTCDPSSSTTKAACATASEINIEPTTPLQGTLSVGTFVTLSGPIVKVTATVGAYISNMTYSYWDDICTDVKLTIPTWAFSSTTLS